MNSIVKETHVDNVNCLHGQPKASNKYVKRFDMEVIYTIALMRVFPKAIVLTTKSHFDVKKTYASIRGLVVRTIALGKTRKSVIQASRYA